MQVSFDIYNKDAVDRLREENPDILPTYSVDSDADLAYNKSQINGAIESAIIQGKSIDHISDDLQKRMESVNRSSAIRTARTATTCAQNAGNLDSFYKAQEMGIATEKQWVCTQDDRTRESHLELDGEHVPLDEEFSNGLQYPGDPSGDPSEVYNCRCTMIAYFPETDESTSEEEESEEEYEAWIEDKNTEEEETTIESFTAEDMQTELAKEAFAEGIDYNPVSELEGQESWTTEEKITAAFQAVGGPDQTDGSCASAALAVCARVGGYDALDFRGGSSCSFFARNSNLRTLDTTLGISKITATGRSTQSAAKNLMKNFEIGENYLMCAGSHAAIVCRDESGTLRYLELQDEGNRNGWYNMNAYGTINKTLSKRFGASSTTTYYRNTDGAKVYLKWGAYAYKVEDIANSENLQEIIGFINTNTEEQKKGAGGGKK